jgi:hypothetical protein
MWGKVSGANSQLVKFEQALQIKNQQYLGEPRG